MILTIVFALFALLWLADAFRLRGRLTRLPVLARSSPAAADEPEDDFVVASVPGVSVAPGTLRAAAAHARKAGLDIVDLVPPAISTWRALVFAASVDAEAYRKQRFHHGRSAGFAVVVSRALLARATPAEQRLPTSIQSLIAWTHALKHYAPTRAGFAVAPELVAPAEGPGERMAYARGTFSGGGHGTILPIQFVLYAFALSAPFLAGTWWVGALALAMLHLQPLVTQLGSGLRSPDVLWWTLFRAPLELVNLIRMAVARPLGHEPDPVEERRPVYAELAAAGTAHLFEPRRADCPMCASTDLVAYLQTDDLVQNKPGEFTLERCGGCGHLFQNPRLSIDGLNYYYKDFYDGLGAEELEALFGMEESPYVNRAKVVDGLATPSRWLDVGAGHGHFCLVAKDIWPGARFDGLDLSESIDDAARRGWIDRGIRGLFPEVAAGLREKGQTYDVVSMSHYLEHTREPRAEIAAAREVLDDGGLLFIEVPDPDCKLRHVLGRYWLPYFQPQHQQLLSVKNVEVLLREQGFEPVRWHRGEAHQPVDFMASVLLAFRSIAPLTPRPWLPAQTRADRVFVTALFWMSLPLLAVSYATDHLIAGAVRKAGAGWSNTYRVVARKQGPAVAAAAQA
jgi:SAM-dependent methyltransferase